MSKNLTFITKIPREISKLTKTFEKEQEKVNKLLTKHMNQSVQLVYSIAHAKRPKVALTKHNRGMYRVSDPDAKLGVPVKTGDLQASIQKEVTGSPDNLKGRVWTEGIKYAMYMEYGTSKIRARPFMRPAYNLTKEAIKKLFKSKQ